jgi:uncharacterized protein YqeY
LAGNDQRAAGTLRLIQAALQERDHCARAAGADDGVSDVEIEAMLRDMIDDRLQHIPHCERTARVDLAEQESEEIAIIQQFLPARMSEPQVASAVEQVIGELGATKLKETGRIIAALKQRYDGQMDFAVAKRLLCQRLH